MVQVRSFVAISSALLVLLYVTTERFQELSFGNVHADSHRFELLSARPAFHQSDGSQLADLIDSPLILAKERIDHMLRLDDPGRLRLIHEKTQLGKHSRKANVDCKTVAGAQSLACGSGTYQNDYAQEAERRYEEDSSSIGLGDSRQEMAKLVSQLQAKLKDMKQQFRLIRARYTSGPTKDLTVKISPRGPRGPTGTGGDIGRPGDQGPQGDAGPNGNKGVAGPKGPIGKQGETGDKGLTGEQGPAGTVGIVGVQGPIGDRGQTGPQGSKGLPGATGSPGANGADGLPGPPGPSSGVGPTGLIGVPGTAGDPGTPGTPGAQGPVGFAGSPGKAGDTGIQGMSGPPGADGVGPAPAIALLTTGDWPDGQCYTKSTACAQLGVGNNLCGQCKPLCDRCDADVGFKLVNPYGLRFLGATFDDSNLQKGSVQVQNVCLLAKYGNTGANQIIPASTSYATASATASMQLHWNGNCAAGDGTKCCDNNAVMNPLFDWSTFSIGNSCQANNHYSKVTVEVNCIFDDDYYQDATTNIKVTPDPDPLDYFDDSEKLESDETSWASSLVSDDGQYKLTIQPTGSAVVATTDPLAKPVWSTGTDNQGTAPYSLSIQKGSLVLSDSNAKVLWSSSTPASGANRAILFDGGNLCLVKDWTGYGPWSRGADKPTGASSATACKGATYAQCHANPSCTYVRRWGCYAATSSTSGTRPWCRSFGRPRSQCNAMSKCVYSSDNGCSAKYITRSWDSGASQMKARVYSLLQKSSLSSSRKILSDFDDIMPEDDLSDVLSDPEDILDEPLKEDRLTSQKSSGLKKTIPKLISLATSNYIWCSTGSLPTIVSPPLAVVNAPAAAVSAPPTAVSPLAAVNAAAPAPGSSSPSSAPPPPPPASLCTADAQTNQVCDGAGKSILNSFCAQYRDGWQTSLNQQKSANFLAKCMAQDCVLSFTKDTYCRFLDATGLCYNYKVAQEWCGNNYQTNGICQDGGADWARSPVGTAPSQGQTNWVPKGNAVYGDQTGVQKGKKYGCACLKNCGCTSSGCWCASDADKKAIGYDSYFDKATFFSNSPAKAGMCVCACDGVLGV